MLLEANQKYMHFEETLKSSEKIDIYIYCDYCQKVKEFV